MREWRGALYAVPGIALPGRVWRRVTMLLSRRALDAELREELAHHQQQLVEGLIEAGHTPTDAHREATRRFGNATVAREQSRRVWSVRALDVLLLDFRAAARGLRRHPAFSIAVLFALTGGIGIAVSAFGVFSALTLRGWQVERPEELVALYAPTVPGVGGKRAAGFTLRELRRFARDAESISGVFAYERRRPSTDVGLNPAPVSGSYFEVLGVQMAQGRAFGSADDSLEAPHAVVVISDEYWRLHMDASPHAVGAALSVRGVPFRVIGIAPPSFVGTDLVHIHAWIPLAALPLIHPDVATSQVALADPQACCLHLAARLAPGRSAADAATELTALLHGEGLRREPVERSRAVQVTPYTMVHSSGPAVSAEMVPVFLSLAGSALLILALACCNVAALLLARMFAHSQEVRMRLALGASRFRLVHQLMTESVLLAVLAGLPAIAVARWLPPWLARLTTGADMALSFTPDVRTVLVAGALVCVSCIAVSLPAAIHVTREHRSPSSRSRFAPWLLGVHMAGCAVLLVVSAVCASVVNGVEPAATYAIAALIAGFVLILNTTGAYGVLAFCVRQRRHEIGIRLALGANPMRLALSVTSSLARAAGLGAMVGVLLASLGVLAVRQFLGAAVPWPPAEIARGLLALIALFLLAAGLPVWRALRVLPASAVRCE